MSVAQATSCVGCECDLDDRTRGCKTCTKRHWMRSDKARAKWPEWNRANYERHREAINARNRAWGEANRERKRETDARWHRENKERHAAKNREWVARNPDRSRAISREANRRLVERQPTYFADKCQERRARLRDAFVEPVDRSRLFEIHHGLCGICGDPIDPESSWHVDHVIPLSRGGKHSYANTQPSHPSCNLAKGVK